VFHSLLGIIIVNILLKSAEQGDARAQLNLGLKYYRGEGVPQNYKQALLWQTKAAEQGIADAQLILGVMYARGKGVKQNLKIAYAWESLAAVQGHKLAIKNRDTVAKKLSPRQLTQAQDLAAKIQYKIDHPLLDKQVITATPGEITGSTGTLEKTFSNSLGMTFNLIPAGTFTMGSPVNEPGRFLNETQHQVVLTKDYYMQTTEITQKQWSAVTGNNPSYFSHSCKENCPVEQVSWDDVQTFIATLNQRKEGTYALPTEAQWEYAARAGSTTAFTSGPITNPEKGYDPVLHAMGWYNENSDNTSHPVAQKEPNAWGLFDMHGNVWEWCTDFYGTYPAESVANPEGPSSGSSRVVRGGSWRNCGARYCRSAIRRRYTPSLMYYNVGFRLVIFPG